MVSTNVPTPVVKDQTRSAARWLPARSLTPVVTRAVYTVPGANGADGDSVAVSVAASYVTVAATDPPPFRDSVKVLDERVAESSGSENVAATFDDAATPVAPSTGDVETTTGSVVSADAV